MQFLVVARDGTDEGALERRQRTRPTHLDSIRPLVDAGNVLVGGALLSESGDMIGSMLLVEFPDREGVDAWLAGDLTSRTESGVTSRSTRSARRSAPGNRRARSTRERQPTRIWVPDIRRSRHRSLR